jgi:hypothetical protein
LNYTGKQKKEILMLKRVFLQRVSFIIGEFRTKECRALGKELFIRKPIGNKELVR